jgi:hypothetical protein
MPDAVYVNTDEIRAMLPEFKFVEGTDKTGLLQEEASDIRDQLLARKDDLAADTQPGARKSLTSRLGPTSFCAAYFVFSIPLV